MSETTPGATPSSDGPRNLNTWTEKHNTPEARRSRIGAPSWSAPLTFETFPRPIPPQLLKWMEERNPQGLILWGGVGVGKTGLALSALKVCASKGLGSQMIWNLITVPGMAAAEPAPCWYLSWSSVLYEQQRRGTEDVRGLLNHIGNVAVLLLDDIDLGHGTPFREFLLLMLIEWSYSLQSRHLVLTVNAAPGDWPSVFGARIADRFRDPRRFLSVNVPGETLRHA